MEVPPEIIEAYSKAFWTYGDTELKEDEWERVVSNIEKGEAVSSYNVEYYQYYVFSCHNI